MQELLAYNHWNQLSVEFLTMIFAKVMIGGFVTDKESAPLKQVVAQEVIVNMILYLLSNTDGSGNTDGAEEVSESESD